MFSATQSKHMPDKRPRPFDLDLEKLESQAQHLETKIMDAYDIFESLDNTNTLKDMVGFGGDRNFPKSGIQRHFTQLQECLDLENFRYILRYLVFFIGDYMSTKDFERLAGWEAMAAGWVDELVSLYWDCLMAKHQESILDKVTNVKIIAQNGFAADVKDLLNTLPKQWYDRVNQLFLKLQSIACDAEFASMLAMEEDPHEGHKIKLATESDENFNAMQSCSDDSTKDRRMVTDENISSIIETLKRSCGTASQEAIRSIKRPRSEHRGPQQIGQILSSSVSPPKANAPINSPDAALNTPSRPLPQPSAAISSARPQVEDDVEQNAEDTASTPSMVQYTPLETPSSHSVALAEEARSPSNRPSGQRKHSPKPSRSSTPDSLPALLEVPDNDEQIIHGFFTSLAGENFLGSDPLEAMTEPETPRLKLEVSSTVPARPDFLWWLTAQDEIPQQITEMVDQGWDLAPGRMVMAHQKMGEARAIWNEVMDEVIERERHRLAGRNRVEDVDAQVEGGDIDDGC